MKYFYYNRDNSFSECELLSETSYKRIIKFKEGKDENKEKAVHPEGVSWGNMYPRLFKSVEKPQNAFAFKGRVLLQNPVEEVKNAATPEFREDYRFQPFLAHVIDSINLNQAVLLTGGTGVGKTTHISNLAGRINQPLLRINFNGETRLSDLIGKNQVVNGETVWADGVLPAAMRMGYWLLLDELDSAEPSVLSLLHPVIEDDPILVLKENRGEVIKPHPNFRIFATANSIGAMQERSSAYAGTNQMNEAFLDRWQVLLVNNLSEKEELKVVKSSAPGLKTRWAKQIVQFAQKARSKNSSDSGFEFSGDNFSTRKVIAWAKKTALLRSPIAGAKISWLDKMPDSERDVLLKILETHFGKTKKEKSTSLSSSKRGRKPKAVK